MAKIKQADTEAAVATPIVEAETAGTYLPFMKRLLAARKALRALERNGRVLISEKDRTIVRYVELDDLLPHVDDALEENGLGYLSYYTTTGMTIEVLDIESGDIKLKSETPLPPYKELSDFGRVSTYVRRYLIATVLGISIATDSDAVGQIVAPQEAAPVVPTVEYAKPTMTMEVTAGIGKSLAEDIQAEQPSLFSAARTVEMVPVNTVVTEGALVAEKKEVPPFPERSINHAEEEHKAKVAAAVATPSVAMPTYTEEQRDASAIIYAKAASSINNSPNEEVLNSFAEKIKDHPKLIASDKQRLMDLITDKKFNLQ